MTDARVKRRLVAILAADVAGFSMLMERDEEGTYSRLVNLRQEIIGPRLSEHDGRLIKTTGDGFLAEFASPIAALRCALAIQGDQTAGPNALQLRIGLNLADVIIEHGGDVYGEGVNVAARLEGLADPGGILISGKIHTEVEGKVAADFEDRGKQQLKNITRPVHVYAVRAATGSTRTIAASDISKRLPLPDKPAIAVPRSTVASLRLFDNGEKTTVVHRRGVNSVNFERDNLMGLLVVRCSIESTPAEPIYVSVSGFTRGEKVQAPFVVYENSGGYVAIKILTIMSPVRITDFPKTDDKGIELHIDFLKKESE